MDRTNVLLIAAWALGLFLAAVALVLAAGARKEARRALGAIGELRRVQPRAGSLDPTFDLANDPGIRAINKDLRQLRKDLDELQKASSNAPRPVPDPPQPVSGGRALPGGFAPDPWGTADLHDYAPPAQAQAQAGKPVELRDGEVVASRSLAAPGSLVTDGSRDVARLYLNQEVEINHIAFEQWSVFFNFRGGGPYMRYTTREPAIVYWNDDAGRGRLKDKGIAEPRA